MRLLCHIENVFAITGRGCVIVPGVPNSLVQEVKGGSSIVIETPTNERFDATIAGLEMINRGRPTDHTPFLVRGIIDKALLPIGSQVFLP